MFTIDSHGARVLAAERTHALRTELAADRLPGVPRARTSFAGWLRRTAERLDPAPILARAA